GDERAFARALHHLVDVAVDVTVESARASCAERTTDHGGEDEPEVRDATLGENHHRNGGDQEKFHHAGFREGDVPLDLVDGAHALWRDAVCYSNIHRSSYGGLLSNSRRGA